MKNQFGLEDLSLQLSKAHVKLNLSFLNKLLESASNSDFPHRDKIFSRKIDCPMNKNKKSAMTIYGWMSGYRTILMLKLIKIVNLSKYSWADVEKNLISIKAGIRRGEIKPNFPIVIGEKIGTVVGPILGDGSVDKRFHSVFFSNSDLELLKEFSKNMEYIFGIKPRIWVQRKKKFHEKSEWMIRVDNLKKVPQNHCVGLFFPKICCDILYILFGKFAEGKNKKITDEIKKSNKKFKLGLLRSFFDDEGSINSLNYMIRIHQDDKIILENMKTFLEEFGIKSQMIRSYNKMEKDRFYFNITGFKEYYWFYNKIGCTSKRKQKEFKLLINKVQNSRYFKKKYAL